MFSYSKIGDDALLSTTYSDEKWGIMMAYSSKSELAERIRHIENNVIPYFPYGSQRPEHRTIADHMAYHKTPGISVAVTNNGELEWAKGYGVLESGSLAPVTTETIFQVCSISKHVAMAGVLRLIQDGVLALDEDVNKYLVSWKVPANGTWQPGVTLRQLLGHTAGLIYNWYRGFRHDEPIPTLLQVLEGRPPANTPPVHVVTLPGSQFRYSGSHYSVIQQIMIDVTGKPFPELMRELVFEPLDMSNSSYDQSYPNTRLQSTAVGHYIDGEPIYGKWRVIPEMAGAGLWTTASDLARLACEIQRAHVGKQTVFLKKAIVDEALTPQISESWGLGVALEGTGTSQRFGHSGDNIGYKCASTTYVKHGMGAVILSNADDGNTVVLDLLRTIAQAYNWPDYISLHTAIAVDPHVYDVYVGEYKTQFGVSLTVDRKENDLFLAVARQQPIKLQPSSETTFFADVVNSEIKFVKSQTDGTISLLLKQEEQEIPAKKIGI